MRKRRTVAVCALITFVLVIAASVVWSRSSTPSASAENSSRDSSQRAAAVLPVHTVEATGSSLPVEVPKVLGMRYREAAILLGAVGLGVRPAADSESTGAVKTQVPKPGTKVRKGVVVRLSTSVRTGGSESAPIVVIDPGHQRTGDARREPVAPGSPMTKERATPGAVGVKTRRAEYEITLEIAERLASKLREKGVQVVLTRTSSEVDLSNVERAQLANRRKADLFVRVHADDLPDSRVAGVSTSYPVRSVSTAKIEPESAKAAKLIQAALLEKSRAKDRGVVPRGDVSGFNWSKVPVVSVECGLLSNPGEDVRLCSAGYQNTLAEGIAAGVLRFLGVEP